jgi:hypothetical protein
MTWAPDYATVSQVRGWLGISDDYDDVELSAVVTAASRAVDVAAGRQFGQVDEAETRSYEARYNRHWPGGGAWIVEMDDLGDITGLTVELDTNSYTDYTLEPRNALLKGYPYTRLILPRASAGFSAASQNVVEVTGLWGWLAVPNTVLQAVKIQASRFWKRRDAPFGIAGSPDQGSELRLLARVDPDVELMLSPYRRTWWVA